MMDGSDMQPGDAVEFLSDRQTEKGPSSGSVIARNGDDVIVRHSDHRGETFHAPSLKVERLTTYQETTRRLWQVA